MEQHTVAPRTPNRHKQHPRVIIAGGGLGGLALAAGLRRQGIDVTVFERDTDLSATGGYHIHLDAAATAALADLLEPVMFEKLLASSATARLQGGDVVRDMRGHLLAEVHAPGGDEGVNIDRITLRLLLAEAAVDAVVPGSVVTGFTRRDDGSVTVALRDGTTHECDLLVGADGTHSGIARTLAGGPTNRPTGLLGIGGRTPVDVLAPGVHTLLAARSGLAVGPYGTGLYIGYHDPVGQAAVNSPRHAAPATTTPTYIWGAVLSESAQTEALRTLVGARLRDATAAFLKHRGWSDRMLAVVTASEPCTVAAFRFSAGSPEAEQLAPWPAGNVTALGDAVHAMPPTAGMGAATAIADAAALVGQVAAVRSGRTTIPSAVHTFEHGMRRRGAAAITASLRPVGWIHGSNTPAGAFAARVALPVVAGVARVVRRRRASNGRASERPASDRPTSNQRTSKD